MNFTTILKYLGEEIDAQCEIPIVSWDDIEELKSAYKKIEDFEIKYRKLGKIEK